MAITDPCGCIAVGYRQLPNSCKCSYPLRVDFRLTFTNTTKAEDYQNSWWVQGLQPDLASQLDVKEEQLRAFSYTTSSGSTSLAQVTAPTEPAQANVSVNIYPVDTETFPEDERSRINSSVYSLTLNASVLQRVEVLQIIDLYTSGKLWW